MTGGSYLQMTTKSGHTVAAFGFPRMIFIHRFDCMISFKGAMIPHVFFALNICTTFEIQMDQYWCKRNYC